MIMNSKLVDKVIYSPNCNKPRNHKIDTITIHMMCGQCSIETCGDIFKKESRQASSNYGIGPDGRIGLYVDEANRSWCSSSKSNDHRAVTIEVASDKTYPYAIKDAAYKSLVRLVADICYRNGIKKLLWKNDKNLIGQVDKQNITLHRWFAATSCPGKDIENKLPKLCEDVNSLLTANDPKAPDTSVNKINPRTPFLVKVKVDDLEIYTGPGSNYKKTGHVTKKGTFTIVEEKEGPGAGSWGKLKSGAGWIKIVDDPSIMLIK